MKRVNENPSPLESPITKKQQTDSNTPEKTPTLSKHTKNMKFMSRGKEAEIREKLALEREKTVREEKWVYDSQNPRIKYFFAFILF